MLTITVPRVRRTLHFFLPGLSRRNRPEECYMVRRRELSPRRAIRAHTKPVARNCQESLFHAVIKDVLATGSRATTTVPVSFELISKLPPSCRSLFRIPLIPTPAVPPESMACRFSGGMPLPLSSTSRLTSLSVRRGAMSFELTAFFRCRPFL